MPERDSDGQDGTRSTTPTGEEGGKRPTKKKRGRDSEGKPSRRTRGPDGGDRKATDEGPDVFLDVPVVKVDEVDLEVEDPRARVSLQAKVLDLVKLNVGADVRLGRVGLTIKGVEARALLKVRLDNVASIIKRVLETIDKNPRILENLTLGLQSTLEDGGSGAGQVVGELGRGAGSAVEDVGEGAGEAGKSAGRVASRAGEGAGRTTKRSRESTEKRAQDT